jgi:hypothetical protein
MRLTGDWKYMESLTRTLRSAAKDTTVKAFRNQKTFAFCLFDENGRHIMNLLGDSRDIPRVAKHFTALRGRQYDYDSVEKELKESKKKFFEEKARASHDFNEAETKYDLYIAARGTKSIINPMQHKSKMKGRGTTNRRHDWSKR